MSTGNLAHLNTSQPLAANGSSRAVTVFDENSQTALFQSLERKAAMAAGIEAMAMRAIETGEGASLERIASLATALAAELDQLAAAVLQIKSNAA